MHDNPFCTEPGYIRHLFSSFRSVTKIDCTDRLGNRVYDDDISEYITEKERSRNELMDLLDDDDEEDDQKNEAGMKTAVSYFEN